MINGLGKLCCPMCLMSLREGQGGKLIDDSGHEYQVRDGLPVCLPVGVASQASDTLGSFNFQYGRERWIFDYDVQRVKRLLRKVFQIDPKDVRGKSVAVIGCGNGAEAFNFAEIGAASVVALDLTDAIRDAADNNAGKENVLVVQADAHHLPLQSGSVDLVYCDGVLPHTDEPLAVLRELMRIAAPGGTVYVRTILEPETLGNALRRLPRHTLRKITSRLPSPVLWKLAALAGPAANVPLLGWALRKTFVYSDLEDRRPEVTHLTTFRMYGDHKNRHRLRRPTLVEMINAAAPDVQIEFQRGVFKAKLAAARQSA